MRIISIETLSKPLTHRRSQKGSTEGHRDHGGRNRIQKLKTPVQIGLQFLACKFPPCPDHKLPAQEHQAETAISTTDGVKVTDVFQKATDITEIRVSLCDLRLLLFKSLLRDLLFDSQF
jgi:hypothetical protein